MNYQYIRPLLFSLPPELAHRLALGGFAALSKLGLASLFSTEIPLAPVRVMGIEFPNPLGLAAGFDKNAEHLAAFQRLGFGFIEVGTVTPRPQPGNPKPRLFRLPEAEALINRMGFNNKGVECLVKNITGAKYSGVLGINIGKNLDTSLDEAHRDYLYCLEKVYSLASYIAINISSPNTRGLRDLQAVEQLEGLLRPLLARRDQLAETHSKYVPLAVKVAPDLEEEEIREMSELITELKLDAVIATNTTTDKRAVKGLQHGDEQGGLSGRPLRSRSTEVLRFFRKSLPSEIPLIGVGGIYSAEDARDKLDAGASLVQVYSGLVYRGPELLPEIVEACKEPKSRESS